MLGSNPNMSAFTPPPPKSASPVSPPPPNQHYHRRSFDVRDKNNGFHGALSRKFSDTSLTQVGLSLEIKPTFVYYCFNRRIGSFSTIGFILNLKSLNY